MRTSRIGTVFLFSEVVCYNLRKKVQYFKFILLVRFVYVKFTFAYLLTTRHSYMVRINWELTVEGKQITSPYFKDLFYPSYRKYWNTLEWISFLFIFDIYCSVKYYSYIMYYFLATLINWLKKKKKRFLTFVTLFFTFCSVYCLSINIKLHYLTIIVKRLRERKGQLSS